MRVIFILAFVLSLVVAVPTYGTQDVLKGPDGETIALVLDCNSCQELKEDAGCEGGAENGFRDGVPCGRCLMDANYGTHIPIAYDSRVTGRLKDENGKPVSKKYVRIFLPNTWSIRSRTADDGSFSLRLGATVPRKGKKPIVLDIGDRTVRGDSKAATYVFFMLPSKYEPCKKK